LSSFLPHSPGLCYSDLEVIEKMNRLKNNDIEFRNSIIGYQNQNKDVLKISNNMHIYDNIVNNNQPNAIIDKITPCIGMGDLLVEKIISTSNNLTIKNIYVSSFIINNYRNDKNTFTNFLFHLIKLLFNDTNIIMHETNEMPKIENLDRVLFPIKKTYIYDDINVVNKSNIEYKNYIIFHTKARFDTCHKSFNNKDLSSLIEFFKYFKTDKTIILVGERNIEINSEAVSLEIISLYNELVLLKNNNNVIDLTYDVLYSGQSDFNSFLHDVELINKADCNIVFGIGGPLHLAQCFSKKNIIYVSDEINNNQNWTLIFNSYNIINKNLYKNIHSFINKINIEFSSLPKSEYKYKSSFNWKEYKLKYNDLNFINNEHDAWNHFINYGQKEGRLYSYIDSSYENQETSFDYFDSEGYLYYYTDLQKIINNKKDAYKHWTTYGKNEGRLFF